MIPKINTFTLVFVLWDLLSQLYSLLELFRSSFCALWFFDPVISPESRIPDGYF